MLAFCFAKMYNSFSKIGPKYFLKGRFWPVKSSLEKGESPLEAFLACVAGIAAAVSWFLAAVAIFA